MSLFAALEEKKIITADFKGLLKKMCENYKMTEYDAVQLSHIFSQESLVNTLSQSFGYGKCMIFDIADPDLELFCKMPFLFAWENKVFVYKHDKESITAAVANPFIDLLFVELNRIYKKKVIIEVATAKDIEDCLYTYYPVEQRVKQAFL